MGMFDSLYDPQYVCEKCGQALEIQVKPADASLRQIYPGDFYEYGHHIDGKVEPAFCRCDWEHARELYVNFVNGMFIGFSTNAMDQITKEKIALGLIGQVSRERFDFKNKLNVLRNYSYSKYRN